jgi:hypothetical protein
MCEQSMNPTNVMLSVEEAKLVDIQALYDIEACKNDQFRGQLANKPVDQHTSADFFEQDRPFEGE